jgi:hypothetical protein
MCKLLAASFRVETECEHDPRAGMLIGKRKFGVLHRRPLGLTHDDFKT